MSHDSKNIVQKFVKIKCAEFRFQLIKKHKSSMMCVQGLASDTVLLMSFCKYLGELIAFTHTSYISGSSVSHNVLAVYGIK
jgi:glycerol-3-phosphate dehydrogenase